MQELTIGQSATLTDFAMCVNHFRLSTPGMFVCVNVPVQVSGAYRVVPGLVAQINCGRHKQCDPGNYDYFRGGPNFVFDVLNEKDGAEYERRKEQFAASGVREYVVWFDAAPVPIWNRLVDHKYVEVGDDEPGMVCSEALPGLWMPWAALEARDWWSVMACTSRGITRRGHWDLMESIWRA